MTDTPHFAPNVTFEEFEAMFESVKNRGRWGADDALGTLNLITPQHVAHACSLVKTGGRDRPAGGRGPRRRDRRGSAHDRTRAARRRGGADPGDRPLRAGLRRRTHRRGSTGAGPAG
jgi:hypothetical protein